MSVKIHGYVDEKLTISRRLSHVPRVGDTVRLSEGRYAKITEVIWCFDEDDDLGGERINLRIETE